MTALRKRLLLATGVAGLAAAVLVAVRVQTATPAVPAAAQPVAAIPVAVASVTRKDLPIYASGIGTVQAWQTIQLQPQVGGRLLSVNFREGQEVHAGDLLAMIDPRPYQAALAQAQAKLAGDQATETNAATTLKRDTTLARNDFASRQQVDNDTALQRTAAAAIQADQAGIAAAQLNLDFCRITSPVDGVVGFRRVDAGNLLVAGNAQPIAVVTQIRPVAVVFTLAQERLPRVRTALAAGSTEVQAIVGNDPTPIATGHLVTPDNSIDTSTGTISLKAEFPNTDRKLWPGQFVTARVRLSVDRNVVVIPLQAVQHGPDGLFAYVVNADHTVAARKLRVAYQDDSQAEIADGLTGGETLVVNGQSRLQPGSRVLARPMAAG
ncbi:MAG: efflux RND transporter periplasmic adaptor subunit [Acetobacteraceae bacterium]|nr:efflux RND transporter periplasmic adaptor subunit [Acetobacteraceae bacterium]